MISYYKYPIKDIHLISNNNWQIDTQVWENNSILMGLWEICIMYLWWIKMQKVHDYNRRDYLTLNNKVRQNCNFELFR